MSRKQTRKREVVELREMEGEWGGRGWEETEKSNGDTSVPNGGLQTELFSFNLLSFPSPIFCLISSLSQAHNLLNCVIYIPPSHCSSFEYVKRMNIFYYFFSSKEALQPAVCNTLHFAHPHSSYSQSPLPCSLSCVAFCVTT